MNIACTQLEKNKLLRIPASKAVSPEVRSWVKAQKF